MTNRECSRLQDNVRAEEAPSANDTLDWPFASSQLWMRQCMLPQTSLVTRIRPRGGEDASSKMGMPEADATAFNFRTAVPTRDVVDEASVPPMCMPNAMLSKNVMNDTILNRDISDMWARSRHMHVQHGLTSMLEGVTCDGQLHTLPSRSSSQEGASALGMPAPDVMLNTNIVPEMDLNVLYASWKRAPKSFQQLATFSSSTEMKEAGDTQDNVKAQMPFASLPMLKQHQIILEDGSIGTYYGLPRDSVTELLQQQASHGKLTSPYNSLSFPQLAQETGSLFGATNLREQCLEGVLEARLRPHSELGEAVCSLDFDSRKRGSLHPEDDLHEKRLVGLERPDHTQFERRVQRELEDLSHSIEDANRACAGLNQSCTLPLNSHACAREGMRFHNSHDLLPLHDSEHVATTEELSNHVYRAFLSYSKVLNELPEERTKLEKQGKGGTLLCLTCKRFSKPYSDTHSLIMHTFMSRKRGLRAEHLGLRKAICTVMGWSTSLEPSVWKNYQHITSEEAKINREDLILWPPALVIHNALGRESSDYETRDAAELAVKNLFKDAGLSSSGIEVVVGNIGVLLVEYSASSSCLLEAERLHLHLATKGCGRDTWLQKSAVGQQESMPKEKRILYGYLACAHDLDLVDRDFRRRCLVLSRKRVLAGGSIV